MHSELKSLAVANAMFHSIRMFIGGFHVIYLISLGISLSQIAQVQIVYSVSVLLLSFPCGYLSDNWSRKGMVVTSIFFLSIYFIVLSSNPGLYQIYFSEIIYALSLTSIAGAFEGWARDVARGNADLYRATAHRWVEYQAAFSVLSGTLGIFIAFYFTDFALAYLTAAVFCLFPLLLFLRVPAKQNFSRRVSVSAFDTARGFRTTLMRIGANPLWWMFAVLMSLFSGAIQVLYFFWQPTILPSADRSDLYSASNAIVLAAMFAANSAVQFLTNRLVRRRAVSFGFGISLSVIAALSAGVVVLSGLTFPQKEAGIAVTYVALLLMFGTSSAILPFVQSYLVRFQDGAEFSSAFALSQVCARLVSILALAGAAMIADDSAPALVFSVSLVFFILLSIALVIAQRLAADRP